MNRKIKYETVDKLAEIKSDNGNIGAITDIRTILKQELV